MNRERWRQRAQRARDAFGLVLLLVLTTYVLASVLSNRGWSAVLLTIVTGATSVVALTSSHARPIFVRRALILAALATVLALISAAFGGRLPPLIEPNPSWWSESQGSARPLLNGDDPVWLVRQVLAKDAGPAWSSLRQMVRL